MRYLFLVIISTLVCKAEAQSSALVVADSLYAVRNYGDAIKSYKRIEDSDTKVILQLARSYQALGIKSKALAYYNKAVKLSKNRPIALTEYGLLLITTRNFIKADSIFEKLTRDYPNNSGYFYQRGRALKELEKKERDTLRSSEIVTSRDFYAKAVQLDSTNQKALYELALYEVKQRNYPEAEVLVARGKANDSLDVEILNLGAQNAYNKGDFMTAIDRFESLISLGVENEFIHRKLGRSYYEQRFYELSRDHYEAVITYDNEDATTHLTLARLNNYLKNFEKAKYHAEVALTLQDQPLDEIYFTMGRTYELHKKYPEAIKVLQKAVKENPENIQAYRAIAICADNYYEDKREVIKLYEQALSKVTGDGFGKDYMRRLIEERIVELKREVFIQGEKGK